MPLETQNQIAQVLAELAELDIYLNRQKCLDKFAELTSIAVCYHHRDCVMGKLKSLLRADQLRSSSQVISTTPDSQSERHRVADPSGSALMDHESGLSPAPKEERAIENPVTASVIKVTYWLRKQPSRGLHYLPEYQPFHTSELCPRSVREWVEKQAKKPFEWCPRIVREWVEKQVMEPLFTGSPRVTGKFQGLDERKDGFLYVYWDRASFGLVKIGCTTRDVDIRLQEWENQCKHFAEEHYRSPFRIKHVARVEKLIHTEFIEHQVIEPYCLGCEGQHIEWFKGLDLGLVIKRIEAWTDWIMKEPYEEKNRGSWQLKDGLEVDLPQICPRPVDETNNSPKKGRKVSIAKKESPRYHLRRRRASRSSQKPSSPTRT